MSDHYTEVTTESWSSRVGGSLKGIVGGGLLFIAAFPLLFWNEGRAVTTAKSLEEGAGAVVAVDSTEPDPNHEGQLVHLAGPLTVEGDLTDANFNVAAHAVKLVRRTEMYLWNEMKKTKKEKQVGGSEKTITTYDYEQKWSSTPIDSSQFEYRKGHNNPSYSAMKEALADKLLVAEDVRLGGFAVSDAQLEKLTDWESIPAEALPSDLGVVRDGRIYPAGYPDKPIVGDKRVRFEMVPVGPVSLIAQQQGNSFIPYQTQAGDSLLLVQTGEHGPQEMFSAAQSANVAVTWFIRVLGFLMMAFGLGALLRPLSVLGDVIPIVGTLVGTATKFVAGILALAFSLVTIGIAWLVARPLMGIALLGTGAAIVGASIVRSRKKVQTGEVLVEASAAE